MSTELSPISSNILSLLNSQALSGNQTAATLSGSESGTVFANVLEDAFNTVTATDQADKASTLELLAGEADSLSALMIDSQKAELSLNLALQMRTKVLDAYKEIMNMQV